MNDREYRLAPEPSAGYGAPLIKALALHVLVAMLLFVSFSSAPEFEPARPIVQATLVQLNSKSPATTQTDQRIAGEAARTAAQRHEAEELKQQQQQQQRQQEQEAARRAAEQKAREEAARAEQQRQQAETEAQRKAQEEARKQAEAEAARAEAARKRAAEEEARKRAEAEAARKKAEEEARRKAAEEAQRRAAAEAEAQRKAQEDARAKALAELLASETQYQRAQADQIGDEVAASYDDLIRRYVSEQWRRPPTARNGMVVEVRISMLPTGQITDAVVIRSSGDGGFDQSAVQAVRNVGRIPEMQQLSRDNPATFDRMYRQRTLRFRPEDLAF
ncbi:cell envelope integrity protein TolA [Halopseudomonas phragmitis]|nr:cell envelope integrity protein TolA [Halopseudomonas phragmitis]